MNVIVIGGGLSGIFTAWELASAGLSVTLIERKKYPFHRVCGEYISNEILPYLEKNDLFPSEFEPADIHQFHLSAINGKSLKMPLDLGGFGISRYSWDNWLIQKLKALGVNILEGTSASDIQFFENQFTVALKSGETLQADLVIGTFGKRSTLDKQLDRGFLKERSPYVGVKYHIRTDFDPHTVALHNFPGGYCGINKIEGDRYNFCYLTKRDNIRAHGSVEAMQDQVMRTNPHLKSVLDNSEFLFEKPEVINEVTFVQKEPVFKHVLMAGDSAGMIAPLCGNGMAMGIRAARLLSQLIIDQQNTLHLEKLAAQYTKVWKKEFANRLAIGRNIQTLFGNGSISNVTVSAGKVIKAIPQFLMKQTHGQPFA